jgi:hypothetical protein
MFAYRITRPDMGRIAADIRRFEQDDRWLRENIDTLRKEFSGMFVAVHDRKLIGAGNTLRDAQEKARSAGINPDR